ncbi:hypothetical protein LUZ61_008836 [Rhynchospora tenuis]|uniref:KIB1-4 beta-propeller domain-containing protein n=1 Tax=Rhynchospora tenuis TaxID=198213 RepID=A0AAD6EXS3_9POAL|nr:hypothetical protein LUZ61_008836 [Rhynchospora tenuis]
MQHHYQHDRDWSKLYPELLQLISKHILDIFDFVHFRAVCKGWRTATLNSDYSQQPWLFWQHGKEDGANFYMLTSTYQWTIFKVPIICMEKWIRGSSQGYLLIMDWKKWAYYLLNPITGKEIHLPPLDERFYNLADVELDEGVPKFVAVCETVLGRCSPILRICQIGDEKWTTVYRMYNSECMVTFYKSSVLIISEFGSKVIDEKPGVPVSIIAPLKTKSRIRLCNPCGNASKLVGISVNDPLEFEFMLFEIYLLDHENNNTRWTKTNNIGDQVVFWNWGSCICWKIDNFSVYKRNSVYYRTFKGLGRFDIENATAEILQREPPDGHEWFTPNLV